MVGHVVVARRGLERRLVLWTPTVAGRKRQRVRLAAHVKGGEEGDAKRLRLGSGDGRGRPGYGWDVRAGEMGGRRMSRRSSSNFESMERLHLFVPVWRVSAGRTWHHPFGFLIIGKGRIISKFYAFVKAGTGIAKLESS